MRRKNPFIQNSGMQLITVPARQIRRSASRPSYHAHNAPSTSALVKIKAKPMPPRSKVLPIPDPRRERARVLESFDPNRFDREGILTEAAPGRARAMATRWRWPPDSSPGCLSRYAASMPTQRSWKAASGSPRAGNQTACRRLAS